MKKIFLLILISVSLNGLAQYPMTQSMATSNTRLQVNGAVDARKGLINGVYFDTTAANADQIDFYDGAQIWTSSDRNFWIRSGALNMWLRMAKFSDVGGTDTHLGNTNLTSTGTRSFGMGGFGLTINQTSGSGSFLAQNTVTSGNRRLQIDANNSFLQSTNSTVTNTVSTGSGNANMVTTELDADPLAASVHVYESLVDMVATSTTAGVPTFHSIRTRYDKIQFRSKLNGANNTFNITFDGNMPVGDSDDSVLVKSGGSDGQLRVIAQSDLGGGGGSNFANADLTFTGDRFHELDDNQLEIANQGGNQLLIDPVDRRYGFGDIPASGNGRALIILDTATVTDGYKMPAMQEAATSKVLYYNTTTGGITYDDVAASPSFEDWYQIKDEILIDDRQGLDYNQSGTGANCTNLTGTNIIDGWLFGLNMETGTTNSGFAFVYSAISPGGAFNPISINNSFRYNVGFKVRFEDVSDGTETFDSFWGFADNNSSTSGITDGVYFRYAHTDSSGTWIAVTESNGTKTEDAVGSAVAADTDYELEISVFGGNAYFYIDKVLVSTISTNIPTGSTRNTSIAGGIFKSAGTTTRKAYVDWIAFGTRKS